MQVPLVGGAYKGRSTNLTPEVCINWFPERYRNDTWALVSTPGATQLAQPRQAPVRGGIEYNGKAYFVIGDGFYEILSSGQSNLKGTLNTSVGRVSMAHNGTRLNANQQIMVVDGTDGWIYDNTDDTFTQISDEDFQATEVVTFLDGYFVFVKKDTDRFYITALYDGTSIDYTDFATAESEPDKLLAVLSDRRDLFLFGEKTTEVWYNAGDPDNTFQRYQGGTTQTGCAAKFSVARFDNTVAWLTATERGDRMVAILGEGYSPQIISTPEVNYRLSTYTTYDDAFAYVYQHEGHEFYCLTFPSHNVTEVYDAVTQQWHQRGHTITGTFPNRERYNCHVFAFGKHLFGDAFNGKIYQLDTSVGTIDGERVPRERITPVLTDEERRIRISSFQLDMEEGVGSSNDDDTSMWLSYSKDGGHTYSSEVAQSVGDEGEYGKRVIWRRLGVARNWNFRLRTWSPKPMVLKGAYAKIHGEA
jgi:hypothetical protein